LLHCPAQLRVVGPDYPLTATVGQDVVLRCYLSPQRDARSLEVRWIRDHISETVHHYRNGEDLYGEQMGAYAGRTELSRDGLSAGSLDLRITGLRPSDDGRYICIVKDADVYDKATVDLEMSATGTDPHLSLRGYEAGGVRVLCRSAGWYPLPQLLWRDARGQHLPSVSQKHSKDQEGLFEIEGAIIVTGSMEGPLSCVVRNSRLQQEAESWVSPCSPCPQPPGKWCLCGRAWAGWALGACVPVARGCWRSSWSLGWEWGVLGLGLPWARDTAGMDERNGDQAPGPELGKACPGLSSAPDGVAPSVPAVKVTLDPHTAHPELIVSEDHRSVRRESKSQQVHNSQDRFKYRCCVLGHEEFREGRHCWEVEVEVEGELENESCWAVGVTRASVNKKEKIFPQHGIWALMYQQGQLMPLTSPQIQLPLSPVPTRIWVCLDCTQQQVSFINADNGVEIYTFTAASLNGESFRPWFLLETL
ncbi:Butyrophilin subfamily 3 member A3, partial [Anas platyrhynchos]